MASERWRVPASWQWARVEEIGEVVGGGTPNASDPTNFSDDGIPWLTPADLTKSVAIYVSRGSRALSEQGYSTSGAKLLPPGTVLFSSRAPIGYCAIADSPICTNQGFKNLILGTGILPEFIRHYLRASKDYAESEASGTTFLELSGARMKQLLVPIPPLAEQKRIVAKIEELTARSRRAKEALDAIPALLDQLRQSILAAAFRGDLTADWRAKNPDVEPAIDALNRFRTLRKERWIAKHPSKADRYSPSLAIDPTTESLPDLPQGWCWAATEEIVHEDTIITYGIVQPGPEVAGGVPYLRGQDIINGKVLVEQLAHMSPELAATKPQSSLLAGDVVLCIIRHLRVAVVPPGIDGANVTQGAVRLRPSAIAEGPFLAYYLASPLAQQWMMNKHFGLAMPRINVEDTRRVPVPLPPIEEQREIIARIRALLSSHDALKESTSRGNAQLTILDQSILAKAFRGELVPQDPTDEPAAVLLDRIRAARAAADPPKRRRGSTQAPPQPHEPAPAPQIALPLAPPEPAPPPKSNPNPKSNPKPAARRMAPAALDAATLDAAILPALWPHGPFEKDHAVRRIADQLRDAELVEFQRLRADGPLYAQISAALESAIADGRLDRPKFGYVRAIQPDPTQYTLDDWRAALLATLGPEPTDRESALRSAAEWARENLGLAFTRLRSDGHILEGLRSALNSAIRRHEIVRHDPKRISRAP